MEDKPIDYAKYCWDPTCPGCGKKAPHSIGFRYTSLPESGNLDEFVDRWVNDETGESRRAEVR
jgi:hypothetical protein